MSGNAPLALIFLLSYELDADGLVGGCVQDLCSLLDDHDAIETMADQLIHWTRPGGGSPEACHQLLCSFKCRLIAHRAAEASFLESRPNNHLADAFETELRALREEFSELAASWNSYLDRWTQSAIATDRAAFGRETTDLMTAFKLRIARENNIIYPLARETGRIALYAD
jgi:hypothetical protein